MSKIRFSKNNPTLYLVISFLIVFIAVFWPTFRNLFSVWSGSDEYSHGFFIIPISLYITWQKKAILLEEPVNKSFTGFVVAAVSLCLYFVSKIAGIYTFENLFFVSFIFGGVAYLFGSKITKKLAFPLFFLLWMIPFPAQLYSAATIPLQLMVTKVSVVLLHLFDIPVLREGNVIKLPEHTLEVVQACSGLRSMISLFTLSLVYGYFTLNSITLRTLLFFSSIPISILVNIIRVAIMGIALHMYNYDLTHGTIHTYFGVFLFIFALLFLYFFQRFLYIWERRSISD